MAITKVTAPQIDEAAFSVPIENGGTAARSPKKAAENLQIVSYDQVDQEGGVALLSENRSVQRKNYPSSLSDNTLPVFFGDHEFYVDETLVIQIVNYDATVQYTADVSGMLNCNISMTGDKISITSKNGAAGVQVLLLNGRAYSFTVKLRKPATPTLTSPTGLTYPDRVVLDSLVPFEQQVFTSSVYSEVSGATSHSYTTWEIAHDLAFSNLYKSESGQASKLNWAVENFDPNAIYYLRLAHMASSGVKSDWSPVYEFKTAKLKVINTPTIVYPANNEEGIPLLPTISASAFSVSDFDGIHVATDWEVSTSPDFSVPGNVVRSSYNDAVNKTALAISPILTYSAIYYARCRYRSDKAASNGSSYSEWSPVVKFTVMADNRYIETPVAGVSGDKYVNVPKVNPSFTGSPFTPMNYSDTHAQTQWQLATDAAFTSIVHDSGLSSSNLTSYTPTLTLNDGVMYYLRIKYKGTIKTSDWSAARYFTTTTTGMLTLVAAGGGGGGPATNASWNNSTGNAGGGGGAGEVNNKALAITPNEVYSIRVAAASQNGAAAGVNGSDGADSTLTYNSAVILTAKGGKGGQAGGSSSSPSPGGEGGYSNGVKGGRGGQGGAMRADTGGASYYASAANGEGPNAGLAGIADLGYNTMTYGGGGGATPMVAVPGLAFRGGNGANRSSVDGGTGSGGGGGSYFGVVGGVGGNGAAVLEYPATISKITTTGATYSLVNGNHRFVWDQPGNYTFVLSETITAPTVGIGGGSWTNTTNTPSFTTSAFQTTLLGSGHVSTDWQIATDAAFTNIVKSSTADTVNKTSWTSPALSYGTTYYIRARYRSAYSTSDWSAIQTFTTIAAFVMNVTIGSQSNYNLRSHAISLGWNQSTPLVATVTVGAAATITSSTTGAYAFDTGGNYPAGSSIKVTANGVIRGCPGAGGYLWGDPNGQPGGPAFINNTPLLELYNNGNIIGGGGGGGLGGGKHNPSSDAIHPPYPGSYGGDAIVLAAPMKLDNKGNIVGGGGGGGGGAGSQYDAYDQGGSGGGGAGYGIGGRQPAEGTYGGNAGTDGGLNYGGSGGAPAGSSGTRGGNGGSLGAYGGSGGSNGLQGSGGSGGAPGRAIVTNGHAVTWVATGNIFGATP